METLIGNFLSENNFTLSIAESCTAGGISSRICSVSGSSKYFMGGIISYSDKSKIRELNVKRVDIEKLKEYGEIITLKKKDIFN